MALNALRFYLEQGAAFAMLALTAYVAGARFLPAAPGRDRAADAARALALGLVVLATLGGLLGLAHLLRAGPCVALVAAVHLTGIAGWRRLADDVRHVLAARRRALAALLLVAPLWVAALYPPIAFDETLYHLPTARAFAATGALPFLPDLRFPVFPHLAEVLSAEMLLLADDVAAHAPALLAVLATAALLLGWGRESAAEHRGSRGLLAAALWLGSPLVVYLGGTGYVDPLLALLVTACCFSLRAWRREGAPRDLALAGVFAGSAASTKYLGLFFVVALAVLVVVAPPTLPPRDARREGAALSARWRHAGVFAVAAMGAMALWYGRLLVLTGNPVFPYLSSIFGANDWTPVHFHGIALPATSDVLSALARGAGRLATLPWDAVARRARVGGLPPLSPAFLAGIPLAMTVAIGSREVRRLLLLVLAFAALFPALPADARYLVTVLPLVSLAAAAGFGAVIARLPLRAPSLAVVLACVLAAPGWAYAIYRIALQGPPPATTQERSAFLRRAVPLVAALEHVEHDDSRPSVVYGLHAENLRDFASGTFYSDWYGRHRYQLLPDLESATTEAAAVLREWGVTDLLVARGTTGVPVPAIAERAGLELTYADDAGVLYAVRAAKEGVVR